MFAESVQGSCKETAGSWKTDLPPPILLCECSQVAVGEKTRISARTPVECEIVEDDGTAESVCALPSAVEARCDQCVFW